eukprot:m.80597 g.80597  ORF g.80597 m.80597 type:complete len:363 (+) comp9364_c0_seq1:1350-2438(+)
MSHGQAQCGTTRAFYTSGYVTCKWELRRACDTRLTMQRFGAGSAWSLSPNASFWALVIGTFGCYILYGLVQEELFSTPGSAGLHGLGWTITLYQFCMYTLFSKIEMLARGIKPSKAPLKTLGVIATLTVATMGFSNTSLSYLNYPTQVVFKSCKLIPVMIGGVFLQRKKYVATDYIASGLLSIGLIIFTLADVEVSPQYSPTGVALISAALCADAIIGNVQERVMNKFEMTTVEMVHKSYLIGAGLIFALCVVKGEATPALEFFADNEFSKTLVPMTLFSLTGYVGIQFVLALVKWHGALTAVTVTTLRKGVTMWLSFLFFPKPFHRGYLVGGFIIFLGLGLNVLNKRRKARLAAQNESLPK